MTVEAPERPPVAAPAPPLPPSEERVDRRRPRSPWRVLAAVFFVLMAALGVARVADWLPSLSNPFATETVDRTGPAVLHALEDISQYRAVTGNFQVIVDLEKDTRYVPSFIKGERTLFVAAGTVDGMVDFSGIESSAVRVSEDRRAVTVMLPAATLSEPRIDPARSYVASRDRGALDRLGSVFSDSPTGERQLYLLAQDKLSEAATDGGLVTAAQTNTREMLQSLLRSLGFESIAVIFQPAPAP